MGNSKKVLHIGVSGQTNLFDSELEAGALDMSTAFTAALSLAVKKSRYSTWQIAALISRLTNHNISESTLEKIKSNNPDYNLRAQDLTALLYITESLEPARVLVEPVGAEVVDPTESKLVRLARMERKRAEIDADMALLKNELGIHK